jgi:hypothetical protein
MPSPHPQSASACGMAGFPVLARLVSAGFGLAVLALILTLAVGFGLVQLPPGPGVGEALLVGAQVVCSAAILWVFLGLRRGIRRGQQIDVQLRHLSEALREQAERAQAADRLNRLSWRRCPMSCAPRSTPSWVSPACCCRAYPGR